MPAISVIMPVYNAMPYLAEAIDSILNQSFGNFEFLIFNDGSRDNSAEVIRSYRDPRIKVFNFDYNQGYVALLNLGISEATGKYIARMDADDIAHPRRLEKQYEFLESHPGHIICGSWFDMIGTGNVTRLPVEDEDIRLRMLYITPFCHPSVMLRTELLRRHKISYKHEHMPAEDFELWVRLSDYGKFHNLPECLLSYRVHDNNISFRERTRQQRQRQVKVQKEYISRFFKDTYIDLPEADKLHKFFFNESGFSFDELNETGMLLQKLIDRNSSYPVRRGMIYKFLNDRFFYCCTTSTHLGLKAFSVANHYPFVRTPLHRKIKFLIKCVLRYKIWADKYVWYTRGNR